MTWTKPYRSLVPSPRAICTFSFLHTFLRISGASLLERESPAGGGGGGGGRLEIREIHKLPEKRGRKTTTTTPSSAPAVLLCHFLHLHHFRPIFYNDVKLQLCPKLFSLSVRQCLRDAHLCVSEFPLAPPSETTTNRQLIPMRPTNGAPLLFLLPLPSPIPVFGPTEEKLFPVLLFLKRTLQARDFHQTRQGTK